MTDDTACKAVPREPTEAMIVCGWRGGNKVSHELAAEIWRSMYDAAPVLATAPAEPPKDGEVAALIEQLEAIQPGFDGCVTGHALAQKAAAMLRRLNPTLPDTLPGQCPRCGEFARLSAPVPQPAAQINPRVTTSDAQDWAVVLRDRFPISNVQRKLIAQCLESLAAAPVPAREHSAIEIAARNLIKVKGRHHSAMAYNALVDAVVADDLPPPAADK